MLFNEQIPMHSTSLFKFEDVKTRHNEKYVKSYYHPLTDYIPYHTHDFYEINIVYSGIGKHRFADKEMLTHKGDIFIIPPHTKHGYSCKENLTVYHILLSNLFVANFSDFLKNMLGYDLLFNYEPMLRSHIKKAFYIKSGDIPFETLNTNINLIESCSEETQTFEAEKVAHVLSLIAALSKTIYELKPLDIEAFPDKHALSLIESMEYIETHYSEKIDLKMLAFKSKLSYSTYLRYFKKLSGTTPIAYQTNCKIKNAVNMLLNTNDSILNIALECGFYDSSHFIREFIKSTHTSPTEFRKAKSSF